MAQISKNVVLAGMVALTSSLLSDSVWATSYEAPPPSRTAPWRNPKTEECGQACHYQRANETIGLQAEYHFNKVVELHAVRTDREELKKEIPGFCLDSEEAEDCYNRYKFLQIEHLRAMKKAIVENNDSIRKLMSEVVDAKGNKTGSKVTSLPRMGEKKAPIIPHFVTYEDVLRENQHLQYLAGNAYERERMKLPTCPGEEAYVVRKQIRRNPDDKNSVMMEVIERDTDGKPVYESGYKDKIAQCKKDRDAAEARIKGMNTVAVLPKGTIAPHIGEKSRKAFAEGRMVLVDATNETLTGKKKIETTTSFQQAAMAGGFAPREATLGRSASTAAGSRVPAQSKPADGNEQLAEPSPEFLERSSGLNLTYPASRFDEHISAIGKLPQ